MSVDEPDDFFGIEYDSRQPQKAEPTVEKSHSNISAYQEPNRAEVDGKKKESRGLDSGETFTTSYGTVRFDVPGGRERLNVGNPWLQGLRERTSKDVDDDNFLESHMFPRTKPDREEVVSQKDANGPPSSRNVEENLIESQLFRYQRPANEPVDKPWKRPQLITKKGHGVDFYGKSSKLQDKSSPPSSRRTEEEFKFEEEEPEESVPSQKNVARNREEKPITTAEDFVKKIRRDEFVQSRELLKENDRDGSLLALDKIISQIPAIYKMSSDEIVDLIMRDILFDNGDLVAIHKPYGLSIHGGPGVHMHLGKLLPKIGERLKPPASFLHVVHRIDKNTTGVCLMTRTKSKATEISQLIADRQIMKKYWCLTVSVPQPPEGIINIPLQTGGSGGKFKTLLATKASVVNEKITVRHPASAHQAETEYSTVTTGTKCALVECKIHTGVKHQIRSHLGFGISCPILGDHKYSDYMGMLPQRLPSEVLMKLGIRSQKSRHLPMYLHAKEVHIPDSNNGNAIVYIKAPIPKFFDYTMRKLRLMVR